MPVHCKESIPKMWNKYSQKRICAATVPVSAFMCLWAMIDLPILLQGLCGPILGIAHRHMNVEIETEADKFPEKNSYMGFSLQCVHAWFCLLHKVLETRGLSARFKTRDSWNGCASMCLEYLYTIGGTSQCLCFSLFRTFDLLFFRVYCAFLIPRVCRWLQLAQLAKGKKSRP